MGFSTIAILSPGNMGAAVGAQLKLSGYDVITCLAGRSDFTRRKAEEAGFRDVADRDALVFKADLILSILDLAKVMEIAEQVASSMKSTGKTPVFADCNATSPATAEKLNAIIEGAGGKFVDVGIVGGAPTRRENFPQFCTSGPHAGLLDELHDKGVRIECIGPEIGQGSAIKICNGAYNKGAFALYAAVMLAAEHYGCTDFLRERLPNSQSGECRAPRSGYPAAAQPVGTLYRRDGTGRRNIRGDRPDTRHPQRRRRFVSAPERQPAGIRTPRRDRSRPHHIRCPADAVEGNVPLFGLT